MMNQKKAPMLDQVRGTPEERVDQAGDASTAGRYLEVRSNSVHLIRGLEAEDTALQSMPDTSPAKWHLAHTTWFFEQFVLGRDTGYVPYQPEWHYLFNSYYQSVGPMHARPRRGLISRPSLRQVLEYRAAIDDRILERLRSIPDDATHTLVELGLHHEQQHQELLLTDIKHLFSCNPLEPAAFDVAEAPVSQQQSFDMKYFPGRSGIIDIGHSGDGFAFDCETPRHPALLQPHAIANRCITNGEYRDFIRDGGYTTPTLWLSEGWNRVQSDAWSHPLYWADDLESEFTLQGRRSIDAAAPVCHISYFEADAFARWAGARLPTEFEWESAASTVAVEGHFANSGFYQPRPAHKQHAHSQLFGDVWEWTSSAYGNYPGFKPLGGSLGEYNGKFMSGQMVLRGGSCATPADHMRATYRNFFYPADRWQFMGLRLARDIT